VEASALGFLFFTLSGSRRWYYILPLLPLFALQIALFLESDVAPKAKALALRLTQLLLAVALLSQLLSPLAFIFLERRFDLLVPPLLKYAGPIIAIATAALYLLFLRRPAELPKTWGPTVVAAAFLTGCAMNLQYPQTDFLRGKREFADDVRRVAEAKGLAEEDVVLFLHAQNDVVFYLDHSRPVRLIRRPEELSALLRGRARPLLVVVRGKELERLESSFGRPLPKPAVEEIPTPFESSERADRKRLRAYLLEP